MVPNVENRTTYCVQFLLIIYDYQTAAIFCALSGSLHPFHILRVNAQPYRSSRKVETH